MTAPQLLAEVQRLYGQLRTAPRDQQLALEAQIRTMAERFKHQTSDQVRSSAA